MSMFPIDTEKTFYGRDPQEIKINSSANDSKRIETMIV